VLQAPLGAEAMDTSVPAALTLTASGEASDAEV